MMITCDFSKRNNLSLTHYLYLHIKKLISEGTLTANQKLPSKRALAAHLGISVITVQTAYQNLIDEGYIYSIEKTGFYVEELGNLQNLSKSQKSNINNNLKENSQNSHKQKQKVFTADFTQNTIGYEKFPFKIWSKVSKEVLKKYNRELLLNQPSLGNINLRKEIAIHLKKFKNMDVDWHQIVIGAGTELLYNFIILFLGREKIYAVENPGYKKIKYVIESSGARCIPTDLDKYGIDICKLIISGAQIVHTTPNHHFPTGIVMPVKRRLELLQWVEQKPDRFIIEDDYDSEFRFTGQPMEPMFNSCKHSKIIYLNTFSKTLSPSFRISYMVLPKSVLQKFTDKINFYSCTVSAIEQFTIAEFMKQEYFSKHIIRMKNYYRTIRNTFIKALENSSLKNKIRITEENAGLHFLLHFITDKTSGQIKSDLEKNGIKINLLEDYYYNSPKNINKTFVINYSGITENQIPKIINCFEKSI